MTKERLRRYRDLLAEKKQLEQQLETIEAALYNPKIQQLKQTPRAPSQGNATEDLANKHLELMDRYREKLAELTMEQLAIEEAIERLPNRERNVLRSYYIRGLKWEEVCVAVGYAWAQTHRIHSRALQLLAGQRGEPPAPKRAVWETHWDEYWDEERKEWAETVDDGWYCSACGHHVEERVKTCPGCRVEMKEEE